MQVKLQKSTNAKKKYMVIIYDNDMNKIKTVHFGAAGMSDYTKHKDEERKQRYIDRHKKRENWNDIKTAGFWSKHLLWNKSTLKASKADIASTFNVKFI